MMKAVTGVSLCLLASFASAANIANMSISGQITPASCSIAQIGGDVDFGGLAAGTLNRTTETALSMTDRTININCVGPSLVSFRLIDNRKSTRAPNHSTANQFGLGLDSSGNPIGYYRMLTKPPTTDGSTGRLMRSLDGGAIWTPDNNNNLWLYNQDSAIYALDPTTGASPGLMTNSSLTYTLKAYVEPLNSLNTTAPIQIDGSTTLELTYM